MGTQQVNIINYQGGKAADLSNGKYWLLRDLKCLPGKQSVPEWVQVYMLPQTCFDVNCKITMTPEQSKKFIDDIVSLADDFRGKAGECVGAILLERTKDPKSVATLSKGHYPGKDGLKEIDFPAEIAGKAAQKIAEKGHIPQVVVLDHKGEWLDAYEIGVVSHMPYLDIVTDGDKIIKNTYGKKDNIEYLLNEYILTEFSFKIKIGELTYKVGLGHPNRSGPKDKRETSKLKETGKAKKEMPVDALWIYKKTER